jgi:hypothetical protein
MELFQYTVRDGTTSRADALPTGEQFAAIQELIFCRNPERFRNDGIRGNQSHPVHEEAAATLPPALRVLRANGCKLRTWPALPTTILECYLNQNWFLALPDLSAFHTLIVLELNDNNIPEVIHPLPRNLTTLLLDCNAIRRFTTEVPASCVNISTNSNPFNRFPTGVELRLQQEACRMRAEADRADPAAAAAAVPSPVPNTIYENEQNIHDTGVQASTLHNIQYLQLYCPYVPVKPEEELWTELDERFAQQAIGSILREFATTPYSMHGISLHQLADRVWLRIQEIEDAEVRKEAEQRFCEEVLDGEFRCLNGMVVRLINSLIGFDEHVQISLTPNQILSARIPATLQRLRGVHGVAEGAETAAYWVACYKETVADLRDVELPRKEWIQWMQPIAESTLLSLLPELATLLAKTARGAGEEESDPTPDYLVEKALLKKGLMADPWEIQFCIDMLKAPNHSDT